MAETIEAGRKIMICVDGSDHSQKAFDWYVDNVRHDDDDLLIVHAPELHPPALPHALATEEWRMEVEKHQEKVNSVLQTYKKLVEDKCKCKHAKVEAINVKYSVGDALCHEANKNQASMIIVGSRGMGLIRRTLIGSVSDYIIHHAHCPVVIVPKK